MENEKISVTAFRDMIEVGGNRLNANAEYVNSLNVFPVPDGDTGTNMNLSFTSGMEHVKNTQEETITALAQALAKGLLMGARGNSGVILSQLFRGFSRGLEACQESINAQELANAFQAGVDTAYKAVMKPVEGTILTVARESAQAGLDAAAAGEDVIAVMSAVQSKAQEALDQTQEQLPVLKEVGVVDSGGQGLLFIYTGFLESLTGQAVPVNTLDPESADITELAHHDNFFNASHSVETEDIKYGFCTEIMVSLGKGKTVTDEFDYDEFRNYLDSLGDSLLVVADDEVVKVHVHTETPGEVMNYGQKFGDLIKIKVDNMRLQHDDILAGKGAEVQPKEAAKKSPYGIISVAAGDGVHELFKSLGVTQIINGGQTMNPSTQDILDAIDQANAENIIILPNNSNIFMAAKQAAEVADQPAVVVPSRSINQGLTAMLGFNDQASLEDNQDNMTAELDNVKSGAITNAIRDTSIDGIQIKDGDYMGIIEKDIKVANADLDQATIATIEAMLDDDAELVTLIYGDQVQENDAQKIGQAIEDKYDDIEIEIVPGNQPVYHYLISVE
ncbi:DAK2 domain-containing protein [Aerococcus sp. YH-aer221]|uniref:DAK2 domain-containing protein n=2 Tax=Aerococcus kribbianus TaxID=2999064 RepID=A0A9X3JD68_9LACT|nr:MULTISPECIES: DAK2 domain-containing protein [unclassified Aerococcus]MCZ0717185.1 DAK2 domain-containing protein [Aerococcus sp. YH-aer221]MCZ0725473.1 DAK2 domain-containing protein [Aerococcus sp. YH-aer222]